MNETRLNQARHLLLTDIGSTTTKALLLEHRLGGYRFAAQAEVPTTVEKPVEDVRVGVRRAIAALQESAAVALLDDDGPRVPFLTTSSAGGGLQMLVFGNSAVETGRIGRLAAYGAGGVILRTLTIDDELSAADKVRLIRELRPDMVLMAGGLDGGAITSVVRLAELLKVADPQPKFGGGRPPLVFCGNRDARRFIAEVLDDGFELHMVDNVRPDFQTLNLEPAKRKVRELFMENVMERAPGYEALKDWTAAAILPTPAGVERILRLHTADSEENVLLVDMGGATTDIFTLLGGDFQRTVAANIGLSYSLANILKEAGLESILHHLPNYFPAEPTRDYLVNKTLNPTYVPQNDAEALIERAAAVEGLRIAWLQHRQTGFELAEDGGGRRWRRGAACNRCEDVYLDPQGRPLQLSQLDLLIGAGGIFAHVDTPAQAFWMLVEGFQPRGIVKLALDRAFKSPHLGVLSTLLPEAALGLFRRECLRELGYVVAPTGRLEPDKTALSVEDGRGGEVHRLGGGELLYLARGGELEITTHRGVGLRGAERRFQLDTDLPVLIDCRGRDELTDEAARQLGAPLTRSGVSAFSFRPWPVETDIEPGEREEPRSGEFEVQRRLPYPGRVLVRPGDTVQPGDEVAVNNYEPPRLFVLDLNHITGRHEPFSEEEVRRCLLVGEGDVIEPGQRVFDFRSLTGVAQAQDYSATIRGRVFRIEPRGVVLVRELQDYDGEPHVINIAERLGIEPAKIKRHLRLNVGDFISHGQIIAPQILFQTRTLVADKEMTGTLKDIDTERGTITVQYELNPVSLCAAVPGTVGGIEEGRAVTLHGRGTVLHGAVGFGAETWGRLSVLDPGATPTVKHAAGIVVSPQPLDGDFLQAAAAANVVGVVAPALPNADWVDFSGLELGVALTGDEDPPFSLLLTEGFGKYPMREDYRELLAAAAGRTASLAPRTQIRAGVIRPRIIIGD